MTPKYATLKYYFELKALEKPQVLGNTFSEPLYRPKTDPPK